MRRGWNNWYHIMYSTYGQWLPGDERGWRTRHHREHIEGDYKHRIHSNRAEGLYGASRLSMAFPPVILLSEERQIVGYLTLESLGIQDVEALALAVTIAHVHLLVRCDEKFPRTVEGSLKHHATVHLGRFVRTTYRDVATEPVDNPAIAPESPWRGEPGRKLWAVRGREKPVRDRAHQLRVFRYILGHATEGGWVWDFKNGPHPFEY